TTARSLFECLAMGKPVITTNMGEVSEILRDGEHALIVEPEKGEVAAAIVKLIRDRKLQDKLGKNAQKLMRTEYSVQKIARRTVQVYDHVLNGQQA
ncbi:MAG TPA: glycosyltransferase, partial [Methylococcales bacterium]|nr:glycosyltransferase [Methylococcales bacterium]